MFGLFKKKITQPIIDLSFDHEGYSVTDGKAEELSELFDWLSFLINTHGFITDRNFDGVGSCCCLMRDDKSETIMLYVNIDYANTQKPKVGKIRADVHTRYGSDFDNLTIASARKKIEKLLG